MNSPVFNTELDFDPIEKNESLEFFLPNQEVELDSFG